MKIAMIGQKSMTIGARGGGIERHVAELSSRLVKRGNDVTVYARRRYDETPFAQRDGVRIVYTPTIYTKHVEAILHTLVSTIHALFQRYDVLHYHGVGPSTLAWIPRLFARRTTVIVTFHSLDRFHQKWSLPARLFLRLGEWTAVYCSHYCITVSHELQQYSRRALHQQTVYIPNGAEIINGKSDTELGRFGLRKGEYVLTVGRMVPQKKFELLIAAFKQLDTEKQLVIVGAPNFTDDYYRSLRELAKDDGRIHFLGYQEGETLEQLYAHCYLYVHASTAEGLPMVVLEAMSAGRAPLVSDLPANVEAMHGAGFTFENENEQALRRRLEYLFLHEEEVEARSEEAQATIEMYFNWDIIAEETESVYITARH
jgi:glycosyltransferase involved in cell wall biosynthesis